jgi:hypothetical protein
MRIRLVLAQEARPSLISMTGQNADDIEEDLHKLNAPFLNNPFRLSELFLPHLRPS